MPTDFLVKVNQWIDLHWKQVKGSAQNSRFFPREHVIYNVVWMKGAMCWELKGSQGKKADRKIQFGTATCQETHENALGKKRIDRANSFTVDTQLSSQMKKPWEKKMEKEKKPKNTS